MSTDAIALLSLVVSLLAFLWPICLWAWTDLRQTDSVVCTVVGHSFAQGITTFDVSIANLGTRSVLLQHVSAPLHEQRLDHGRFYDQCTVDQSTPVPRVINRGDMVSVRIEAPYVRFLETVMGTGGSLERFYYLEVEAFNPHGVRMFGKKYIARLALTPGSSGVDRLLETLNDSAVHLCTERRSRFGAAFRFWRR
jgi:hypothetical protein